MENTDEYCERLEDARLRKFPPSFVKRNGKIVTVSKLTIFSNVLLFSVVFKYYLLFIFKALIKDLIRRRPDDRKDPKVAAEELEEMTAARKSRAAEEQPGTSTAARKTSTEDQPGTSTAARRTSTADQPGTSTAARKTSTADQPGTSTAARKTSTEDQPGTSTAARKTSAEDQQGTSDAPSTLTRAANRSGVFYLKTNDEILFHSDEYENGSSESFGQRRGVKE